ncbi:hypothetical protein ACQY0O_006652 [Thecaphora frezii]
MPLVFANQASQLSLPELETKPATATEMHHPGQPHTTNAEKELSFVSDFFDWSKTFGASLCSLELGGGRAVPSKPPSRKEFLDAVDLLTSKIELKVSKLRDATQGSAVKATERTTMTTTTATTTTATTTTATTTMATTTTPTTTPFKPHVVQCSFRTPSSSTSGPPPEMSEMRWRRAKLAAAGGCPMCPAKHSGVRQPDYGGPEHHSCHTSSRRFERHDDDSELLPAILAEADSACFEEMPLLRLLYACQPFVTVFRSLKVRFRDDLEARCKDWLYLLGSSRPGAPGASIYLQHFATSVDVGDATKGFDNFPYDKHSRMRTAADAHNNESAGERDGVPPVFDPQRCYFECLRLFNKASWYHRQDFIVVSRESSPLTGTYDVLLRSMAAVKIELLYRIKKQAGINLPSMTLEHHSSRHGLQLLAATFAWLSRCYVSCRSTASVVPQLQDYIHPIYDAVITDILDDCMHLQALLDVLPERFACFCCAICDKRQPQRKALTFFQGVGWLLEMQTESVCDAPTTPVKERRAVWLGLTALVIMQKWKELCEELKLKRRKGAMAHHCLQLKRRGAAAAAETDDVLVDICRATKRSERDLLFQGDILAKILFTRRAR